MLGTVSWKVIDLRDKMNNLATPSWMTGTTYTYTPEISDFWLKNRLEFILDSPAG
ncbi:MAG: hypothetical protein RMY62_021840 [Nostoc sp. ZfuVER08]